MNTLAIVAMREGTGKTAITVGLGLLAQQRELRVGYMKPKGTRLQSRVGKVHDRDPVLATEILGIDEDLADLEPIVYSPTFIQNAVRGHEIDTELRERVRDAFTALADSQDVMLLEGAGHLAIGAVVDLTDPEIASMLDARVVLVAEFDALEDLDNILRATREIGDALVGVIFNRVHQRQVKSLEQDAIPFLEGRDVPVLGIIQHDRELAGVTVSELADELGAVTLTEAGSDDYVDQFLVAAMGPDEAFRQFRRTRNAAVVTGGDRSEIHSAAIEAPGVSCLIVTGSFRPPTPILNRAEKRGLAVMAVNADTLTTVERAEGIVRSGRTQDVDTVQTMAEYLDRHVEVDKLLDTADNFEPHSRE